MNDNVHLSVDGVWAIFDRFVAVRDVRFNIRQGELRCLIGPNGAGKSTLLDLICGKVIPAKGNIIYEGKDITRTPEYKRSRLGVGRKFQVPMVFPDLTVEENLAVADNLRARVWSGLGGLWYGENPAERAEVLNTVGLENRRDVKARQLSHGEIQWLEMAMLLVRDSGLLLMDEPTAGMTAEETAKTGEIFSRLKGKHTLIVVEHDMQFVRQIAETVTVLHQGQILAEGDIDSVQNSKEVQRVYLGSVEAENASVD